MSPEEAVAIAGRAARRLNMRWSDDSAVATPLWRLWPFGRRWRVVSRVPSEIAETTIVVDERTKQAYPRQVRHALSLGQNRSAP